MFSNFKKACLPREIKKPEWRLSLVLKSVNDGWHASVPIRNLRICQAAAFLNSFPSIFSFGTTIFSLPEDPYDRMY